MIARGLRQRSPVDAPQQRNESRPANSSSRNEIAFAADRVSSTDSQANDSRQAFVADSLFLLHAFQTVCRLKAPISTHDDDRHFVEALCFATGPQLNAKTFALSQLIGVKFSEQTSGHVSVDDESNVAAMQFLDDVGLPLLCHIHSHPTFGPHGTTPSLTDLEYQRRLESAGHVCIGLIATRDGYIGAFGHDQARFRFKPVGNLVETIDDNTFRISVGEHNSRNKVRVLRRAWPHR